jgi:hypothetical protein
MRLLAVLDDAALVGPALWVAPQTGSPLYTGLRMMRSSVPAIQ